MHRNTLGVEVPDDVAEKAKEHGCVGGVLFVYKDEQYGDKPPKASIGCTYAKRFRRKWWNNFKVRLSPGWVAFRSPSRTVRLGEPSAIRVPGKALCEPCLICGEDRYTERAHFPATNLHGGTETIRLCPTHHRLLEFGRLSDWELMEICQKKYPAGSGTGPILLSQASFLLAHFANSGPVPLSHSDNRLHRHSLKLVHK